MRKLTYLIPAILISGCSILDSNSGHYANSGHYSQDGCQTQAQSQYCAPGESYAVASEHHNPYEQHDYAVHSSQSHNAYSAYPQHGHSQTGYVQSEQTHTNYGQPYHAPTDYAHSAPVYAAPSAQLYSGAQGQYGAPVLRGTSGPGYFNGLRGRQSPAYRYGTLGGVLYDTDAETYGLEGRLGYHSGRILGAELEGSLGVIDDEQSVAGLDIDSKFDYNVAAFALARLPLSERFSVHARGGYDFRKFSATGTDGTGQSEKASANFDGFAYGIGAEYGLSPRNGLRVDYTRYDNEIAAIDSLSASFVRKF